MRRENRELIGFLEATDNGVYLDVEYKVCHCTRPSCIDSYSALECVGAVLVEVGCWSSVSDLLGSEHWVCALEGTMRDVGCIGEGLRDDLWTSTWGSLYDGETGRTKLWANVGRAANSHVLLRALRLTDEYHLSCQATPGVGPVRLFPYLMCNSTIVQTWIIGPPVGRERVSWGDDVMMWWCDELYVCGYEVSEGSRFKFNSYVILTRFLGILRRTEWKMWSRNSPTGGDIFFFSVIEQITCHCWYILFEFDSYRIYSVLLLAQY